MGEGQIYSGVYDQIQHSSLRKETPFQSFPTAGVERGSIRRNKMSIVSMTLIWKHDGWEMCRCLCLLTSLSLGLGSVHVNNMYVLIDLHIMHVFAS